MRRCTTASGRPTIGAVDLEPYLGPCRVIHAIGCGPLVRPEHLAHAADRPAAARAGAHLRDARRPRGRPTFAAFAPETIDWLAGRGVRLVGIDSQSVDPADSKTLDSHQQLLQHDLRVLENLVLDDVPAGDYELIALPLKLTTGRRLAGARGAARTADDASLMRRPATTASRSTRADPLAPLRDRSRCPTA